MVKQPITLEGPLPLPEDWTACGADTDCVHIGKGCCFGTPLNRAHLCEGQQMLHAAGECPRVNKDACEPVNPGGWSGIPGKCRQGQCVMGPWPGPAAREEAVVPPGFACNGDVPLALPAAWTVCQASAECSFVSLGCCHTTPVNRAHTADADRALAATGQPWCPVKTACGPGSDGTWAGTPGTCRERTCVRSTLPGR